MRSPAAAGRPASPPTCCCLLRASTADAPMRHARAQVSGEAAARGGFRRPATGAASAPPGGKELLPAVGSNLETVQTSGTNCAWRDGRGAAWGSVPLAPGDYPLQRTLCRASGEAFGRPVRVLAERPGSVRIRVATTVGFFPERAPYWWFRGSDIARCLRRSRAIGNTPSTSIGDARHKRAQQPPVSSSTRR